jgi:hypothetical protein
MATGPGRGVRVDFMKLFTQVATTKTYTTPFVSLSTANPNDDGQSNAEPTVTNGYAAQAVTWNAIASPALDAAANATNAALITFGPSSGGAFSTGATLLSHIGIWNSATLRAEVANFLARGAIAGGGFAVNAAGISITFAATTGIVMGCISA